MASAIQDKIALVTGASRGIGRATALALAREGAHVIVTARAADELNTLVAAIEAVGREALAVPADVRQEADVERLAERARDRFGRVDVLVNNIGVGKYGPLETFTADDYDWMMDSNMRTSFLTTRAFMPAMLQRREGWLIFLGSVAGLKGLPNEAIYCASKSAQYAFAQSLDHECRPYNVKVSYIAPGGVNTYFALGTGRTAGDPSLEHMLDSEDVAEAVVFACNQPPKSRVFLIGMRPMSEVL
jgi:3-oxoacyl-[acyl-carrier protein] reductase